MLHTGTDKHAFSSLKKSNEIVNYILIKIMLISFHCIPEWPIRGYELVF